MKLRLRFSLRMLLVAIAAIAFPLGWVFHQLDWIRQREAFLDQYGAENIKFSTFAGETATKPPWPLGLFGELGYPYITSAKESMAEAQRLFPEALYVKQWAKESSN
jgi:hypothetical protein